ncbi:dual specificity protein phosphatase CDC14C-like [Adelges cooleyi]|uniref:dual specificity protein phosphatase CDC14C-like n=1 Tax=Adelges cooleyi TaxID=133065 RepID=UPI00217F5455|nr:dual specificity protein phosphatase CDC14C-like [Adelges cooleyi]
MTDYVVACMPPVTECTEFIKDRLYFATLAVSLHKKSPLLPTVPWGDDANVAYLNFDDTFIYDHFYKDFGPLNLAMVYRYCVIVRDKLKQQKPVVHWASESNPKKRSNAAVLICAYMIIEHNWTAHQAYMTLSQNCALQFMEFRDASYTNEVLYGLTVEDCVNALFKAKWFGFFNFDDFDLDEYEKYEATNDGDFNWILPGTMLAFSSPHAREHVDKSGHHQHSPAYYYKYFIQNNVKHVIRLNSKRVYNAKRTFVATGHIDHTDLIFPDGTSPTDLIVLRFLCLCEDFLDDFSTKDGMDQQGTTSQSPTSESLVENNVSRSTKGAVAVHCKAGLGRTGCLIACYIMKHWSFTAEEAIAWIRICRPGSVTDPQHEWLILKQNYLRNMGKLWRQRITHSSGKYKRFANGVNSIKRHESTCNPYTFVEPPPLSSMSSGTDEPDDEQANLTAECDNVNGSSESVQANKIDDQCPSLTLVRKKMKISKADSDLLNLNHFQVTMFSKNDDPKRKATNQDGNVTKKTQVTPSIVVTLARCNSSNDCDAANKGTNVVVSGRTHNCFPRTAVTALTNPTNVSDDQKESYAYAAVASTGFAE